MFKITLSCCKETRRRLKKSYHREPLKHKINSNKQVQQIHISNMVFTIR